MVPCPCQLCPSPEATVHLTRISPAGVRSELHLCRACIARLHLRPEVDPPDPAVLLAAPAPAPATAAPSPVCDRCHLALEAYSDTNLFGCPACYESFDQAVMALLERYQGAGAHTGRRPVGVAPPPVPRPAKPAPTLRALRMRLNKAVAEERYEDAAALRDDIARREAESP